MTTGRKTARAAIWAFLATAGAKVITLVSLALLARLLAPHEFGLLAFALVYITYAETIGDLGSGMALVYWPDRRDDAAQVTFAVNSAAGIFWFLLTLLIAPLVADFFNVANGAPIVRLLGLSFVLRYLGNAHDALSKKDLRFRARLVPELSLAAVKAIVSIALAYLGFGVWSLVWGQLAGVGIRTLLLWVVVPWRPSFRLPMDLLRPMLAYGRGIIVVHVLAAITHHADLAVVGRLLGTTALGLYQVASKIPEMTVVVMLWAVSTVLFPAFSKLHAAGESLRQPYLTATRYISAAALPASAGLFLLARPVILLFLGSQWIGAVPILQALTVYTAMRAFSTHAGDVLKATGRAQLLAGLSVVKAMLVVPALLIGARFGASGVAWGLAIAAMFGTMITLTAASRLIGVSLGAMLAASLPSIVATAIMSAAVFAWMRWEVAALAQVLVGTTLGAVIFAGALALLDRDLVRNARRHFLPRTA